MILYQTFFYCKSYLSKCNLSKYDYKKRPLLRGRDIKRYSYEFADLYLISTFPSLKVDIEIYPAVKQYLLSFGYDRIKQTGDKGARKKTNNKWFETQDAIGYWDDFSKQKIIWKIIGNQMAFVIDSNGLMVNNACYILTGDFLEYLTIFLNSKIIKWYSFITNMNKTGVGDIQIGAQNVVLFPIPILNRKKQLPFIDLLENILQQKSDSVFDEYANKLVNETFGLNNLEISYLNSQ